MERAQKPSDSELHAIVRIPQILSPCYVCPMNYRTGLHPPRHVYAYVNTKEIQFAISI
jgi:hypothetical protein